MASLLSAVRKSFRLPTLEDHIRTYQTTDDPEKKRSALWGIRDQAEKKKNPTALIQLGIIPILVKGLTEHKGDERMWVLWVLRFLAEYEEAATLILQEPNVAEGLAQAIKESNVGSENAKRSVECVKLLSSYLSTQFMLAREDIFEALTMAMIAAPTEAVSAMQVYYNLAETESGGSPSYKGSMATPQALKNLETLSKNSKISQSDREMAEKLIQHLTA